MERKRKLDLTTTGTVANGRAAGGCPAATGDDDGPSVNPYTDVPYTPRYYGILETRKGTGVKEEGRALG